MHLALTHDFIYVVFCMPHTTLRTIGIMLVVLSMQLSLSWWCFQGNSHSHPMQSTIWCTRSNKQSNWCVGLWFHSLTPTLALFIYRCLVLISPSHAICLHFMLTKFANHPLKFEWLMRKWSLIETYKFWNM